MTNFELATLTEQALIMSNYYDLAQAIVSDSKEK